MPRTPTLHNLRFLTPWAKGTHIKGDRLGVQITEFGLVQNRPLILFAPDVSCKVARETETSSYCPGTVGRLCKKKGILGVKIWAPSRVLFKFNEHPCLFHMGVPHPWGFPDGARVYRGLPQTICHVAAATRGTVRVKCIRTQHVLMVMVYMA